MRHYKFGGSTAERTIKCPSWHRLAEGIPVRAAGSHAHIGSMLHEVMETILITGEYDYEARQSFEEKYVGTTYEENGHKYAVTAEHIRDKVIPAAEAFEGLMKKYNCDNYTPEITMEWDEETGGTSDIIASGPGVVVIGDWKFGFNDVSPIESSQGLFYTMLARDNAEMKKLFVGVKKIVIAIIQPNDQGDTALKTWETDMAGLNAFQDAYFDALDATDDMDEKPLDPVPGEHCAYCPAMVQCPAKTGLMAKMKRVAPGELAHQKVTEILHISKEVEKYIKEVRAFALSQMELGVKFQGYKIVNRRANRSWIDEEVVIAKLKAARKIKLAEAGVFKLKTPAKMAELCKLKNINFAKTYGLLCHAKTTGTVIAPESDKRPEVISLEALTDLQKLL